MYLSEDFVYNLTGNLSMKNNSSKGDFLSATGIFIVLFRNKEIVNCLV